MNVILTRSRLTGTGKDTAIARLARLTDSCVARHDGYRLETR